MARRYSWSFGTVLCLALAIGFAIATVYFAVQSRRARREYDEAVTATTLKISCDLSKVGEYRGTFRATYTLSHAHELHLAISPPAASETQLDQMMKGFAGKVIMKDSAGQVVREEDVKWEADSPTTRPTQAGGTAIDSFKLARFFGSDAGTAEFVLSVISPAAGMTGHSQQLIGRYELCGMEQLAGAILGLLALACGVSAGVLALAAVLLARRAAVSAKRASS